MISFKVHHRRIGRRDKYMIRTEEIEGKESIPLTEENAMVKPVSAEEMIPSSSSSLWSSDHLVWYYTWI